MKIIIILVLYQLHLVTVHDGRDYSLKEVL